MKHKAMKRLGICLCIIVCFVIIKVVWVKSAVGDSSSTAPKEQHVERTDSICLNDIRFADFKDEDWLDNEYIRCLRRYLDDYNSGKIKNEELDQYKEKLKGKFVIGNVEPCYYGGLFLQITFIDYPDDVFSSWVYSSVDEETKTVLDYEVRSFTLNEKKSGFTKEEILKAVKEHPELKLW